MYRPTFSWPRHQLELNGQFHAPAVLPPGKRPRYLLDRRLGGPQNRSGKHGEVTVIQYNIKRSLVFLIRNFSSLHQKRLAFLIRKYNIGNICHSFLWKPFATWTSRRLKPNFAIGLLDCTYNYSLVLITGTSLNLWLLFNNNKQTNFLTYSPQSNDTDRATAACRRS
jgi:hypothetical protein